MSGPVGARQIAAPGGLLRQTDGLNQNRHRLLIQRAVDRNFLPRKLLRCPLIAQLVGRLTVIQDVRRSVRGDASDAALASGGSHLHLGMVRGGTHTVRNGAHERPFPLCRSQRDHGNQSQDERLHGSHLD